MKASKYNLFWSLEDGKEIAFNSMSCALAEIDSDFKYILDNINTINYDNLEDDKKELVDNMMEGNYIINDYVDELKIIEHKHLSGKYHNEGLGLTIAPTLACNFACPYCYETAQPGFMSQEVIDGIISMVTNAATRKKSVSTTWYGGEPLLAIDLITEVSEKIIKICEENGVNYNSFMVTNGYLIDDEKIDKMKACKITGAQITIDGPPDIHNTRRILKNGSDDTFKVIINNIKKMVEKDLKPNIRVNIDKTNINRLEELLNILKDNGLSDLSITLGHVTAYTEACKSVSSSCFNTEEYAKESVKYKDILHRLGFKSQSYPYYPGTKANYCCADSISSFVVDPNGYMYKCWNDIGSIEKAVGNIKMNETIAKENMEKMHMNNVEYVLWSPFNHKECKECDMLPICMGGCPYNGRRNDSTPDCEKWKYCLEETMKSMYNCNKDKVNGEVCETCSCI